MILYILHFSKKDNTCYKNFSVGIREDVHNVLYSLRGGAKDYTGTATTGICFYDRDVLESKNFSSWASTQVTVDTNTITLTELLAWDVGGSSIDVGRVESFAFNLFSFMSVSLSILVVLLFN